VYRRPGLLPGRRLDHAEPNQAASVPHAQRIAARGRPRCDASRGAKLESREYAQAQLALGNEAAMEAYAATPTTARGASAVTTEGE
jgi:hypothetical protein